VTWRQEFRADNRDLNLASADGNQLINGEENDRSEHEVVGVGGLDHPPGSVQQHQDEEDGIAEMNDPEGAERVTASVLDAEDEDEEELECQQETREPCSVKQAASRCCKQTWALYTKAQLK